MNTTTCKTNIVEGTALYLRAMRGHKASDIAINCKAMGLSWAAIGAVWQDAATKTRLLNTVKSCREIAKALRDVGITPYVWGYPWLGGESEFISRMIDCAGDDRLHLLDPELGMNPTRSKTPARMARSNLSAATIVSGLRANGAKVIGLSTYGGLPPWFPLDAFLRADVDFAGGQTYTDDATIDTSIASYLKRMQAAGSTAQLVPNFGLYSRTLGKVRSKRPLELRAHLDEFINESEPVKAVIGWAENFSNPALVGELAVFSRRLAEYHGGR